MPKTCLEKNSMELLQSNIKTEPNILKTKIYQLKEIACHFAKSIRLSCMR
jgi:hypothetical protein